MSDPFIVDDLIYPLSTQYILQHNVKKTLDVKHFHHTNSLILEVKNTKFCPFKYRCC